MNHKEIERTRKTNYKITEFEMLIEQSYSIFNKVSEYIKNVDGYTGSVIKIETKDNIFTLNLNRPETVQVIAAIQAMRQDDVMKAEKALTDYQPGKE